MLMNLLPAPILPTIPNSASSLRLEVAIRPEAVLSTCPAAPDLLGDMTSLVSVGVPWKRAEPAHQRDSDPV